MADLCQRCNHFAVHPPVEHGQAGYYRPQRLCLWALMRYDCTRWRLWR